MRGKIVTIAKRGGNVIGDLTYEYDANGKRTRMGGSFARSLTPPTLASASYNAANQQLGFGSQTLSYDLNGNLLGDGQNSYTWDARNRLTSVNGPGVSASFQYDAAGGRSSKTINGATTSFLYDGANVVQEQSAQTGSANILSGGIDETFMRSDSSGTFSPMADGLGSSLSLTDAAGAVQTEYAYGAFGSSASTGTASNNSSQYTGRENDGTGLQYNRARYYSPGLQRFISEDPIGFMSGDTNFYAYVGNNPINKIDPYGLDDADRAFGDQINPPALSNNPWYWSHNESADNPILTGSNPPTKLYYIPPANIQFTPPITLGIGIGAVISRTGIYPQVTFLNLPGFSATIPLFPFSEEPKPGWSSGFSACYGGCLSVTGDNGGGLNSQIGLGTPGGGAPITYTFEPWYKWPDNSFAGRKN